MGLVSRSVFTCNWLVFPLTGPWVRHWVRHSDAGHWDAGHPLHSSSFSIQDCPRPAHGQGNTERPRLGDSGCLNGGPFCTHPRIVIMSETLQPLRVKVVNAEGIHTFGVDPSKDTMETVARLVSMHCCLPVQYWTLLDCPQ